MRANDQLQPTGEPMQHIPEPLAPEMDKPAPYPVEALPLIMRDAAKAIIERKKCPDALAAFSVLGAVAYLAQTRVDVVTPVSQMPCSLYMLALGDSGTGKSEAMKEAFRPLMAKEVKRKVDYSDLEREQAKAIANMKPKEKREYLEANPLPENPITMITDGNCSPSRVDSLLINEVPSLFITTDEGGQFFGGNAMKSDTSTATIGGFTKWWDKGEGERVRATSNLDGGGYGVNKRLSLFMMAQEIAVKKDLNDPVLRGQGFLARFLLAAPEYNDHENLFSQSDIKAMERQDSRLILYWDKLNELDAKPRALIPDAFAQLEPEPLSFTDEATAAFWEGVNHYRTKLNPLNGFTNVNVFVRRAMQVAARVAAVFAFFEGKQVIDASELKAAMQIVNHSIGEWLRLTNAAVIDTTTSNAIQAIDWLLDQVKKGRTQWLSFTANGWGKSGFKPLRSAKVRNAALAELVDKYHLLYDAENKTFTINPLLFSDSAESAETAGTLINQGLPCADEVRTNADKVRTAEISAQLPHPSAKLPHAESPVNAELPHYPHNPHPPEIENGNGSEWTGGGEL